MDGREPNWKPIAVDGEAFEWHFTEAVIAHAPFADAEPDWQKTFLIVMRRAGDRSFNAVEWKAATPPGEADAADAVRSRRDKLPTADDPRRVAQRHASALHVEWGKLPLFERMELSRVWLERWERTSGEPPPIKDPSNLHAISVHAQLAAQARSVTEANDERAAQERDVRAALDRMTK